MTDSSGDSDCFESADEEFGDENIVSNERLNTDAAVESNASQFQQSSPISSNSFVDEGRHGISNESDHSKVDSLQYRKRPERGKNLQKKVVPSSGNRKLSLNDQIFKAEIIKPDILIQDITSNLTKNINKGFNTFHQTSKPIKDFLHSFALPVSSSQDASGFSYDDDDEMLDSKKSDNDDTCSNVSNISNIGTIDESENLEQNLAIADESIANMCNEMESAHITDSSVLEDIKESCSAVSEVSEDNREMDISHDYLKNEDLPSELNARMEVVGEENGTEKIEHITGSNPIETGEIFTKGKENDFDIEKSSVIDGVKGKTEDMFSKLNYDNTKLKITGNESDMYNILAENEGWDSTEMELESIDIENNSFQTSQTVKEKKLKTDENLASNINESNKAIESHDIEVENNALESTEFENNEGWDDFDIDDEDMDQVVKSENTMQHLRGTANTNKIEANTFSSEIKKSILLEDNNENVEDDTKWSGWDNFGAKHEGRKKTGWTISGWGVNALLNTASSVTQGITTVLEAGLGAPDPEQLAKMERHPKNIEASIKSEKELEKDNSDSKQQQAISPAGGDNSSSLNLFPVFGITNLVAGVTNKLVEHSKVHEIGSKVLSGGLDTLESFGKKTMEVLQEGDPGLKKKRALLLGQDKPILSQVLREAKAKAEMEDKKREEKQMAKMCHFETLFDDFQGLIHLEALEMLSRQCELKLDQMKTSLPTEEIEELISITDEVKQLCIIDEDELNSNYAAMIDFKVAIMKAVEPLQNEISIHKIIEVYEELETWMKLEENVVSSPQNIFQKAIKTMAELTAATVQEFHKGGELLSIKEHRKTVEEADALLQLTGFMCCEIHHISEWFLKLHKSSGNAGKPEEFDGTKIIKEAENATSYIKDAFNLLIPVLQLGAAL